MVHIQLNLRYSIFVVLVSFLSCVQEPRSPKDAVALEKLALSISQQIEPGEVLTRRHPNSVEIYKELNKLGAHGALVLPDSSSVLIRMVGIPRNYIYYYKLTEKKDLWDHRVRQLGLKKVSDKWYWYECKVGRRHNIPC